MRSPLDETCAARLPAALLPALAPLRCEPGLHAARAGDTLWLRWDAGNDAVAQSVLPLPGAELFVRRDDRWYRLGRALPAFDVPADLDYRPLAHVLFPAPLTATPAPILDLRPERLTLRRDPSPRPTAAVRAALTAVQRWADTVPTMRLAELRGVVRAGEIFLLGPRLPALADGVRFWGRDILFPLGYAPEPELPESALKQVFAAPDDSLLVVEEDRIEAVSRRMLAPLTRAGLRLAGQGVRHE